MTLEDRFGTASPRSRAMNDREVFVSNWPSKRSCKGVDTYPTDTINGLSAGWYRVTYAQTGDSLAGPIAKE
ncbi:hypothetical protein [Streptomyces sp. NPDC003480]